MSADALKQECLDLLVFLLLQVSDMYRYDVVSQIGKRSSGIRLCAKIPFSLFFTDSLMKTVFPAAK